MSDLTDFVKENDSKSKFIKFEDGEPIKGVYKGAKLVPDTFNKGESTMEYTLEIDGDSKTFNSKSNKLAKLMMKMDEGTKVEIVKTGTGTQTLWYVYDRSKKEEDKENEEDKEDISKDIPF